MINRENIPWLVDYYRNSWPFDMVVLDESSSFKSSKAKRFKSIKLVRPRIQRLVAVSYTHLILVPKTNASAKAAIDQAVAQAIEAGVSKCWNGVRPPQPAICVHDGDVARPSDGQPFGEECRGCRVFTASSKNQPFVVKCV